MILGLVVFCIFIFSSCKQNVLAFNGSHQMSRSEGYFNRTNRNQNKTNPEIGLFR